MLVELASARAAVFTSTGVAPAQHMSLVENRAGTNDERGTVPESTHGHELAPSVIRG
jgi:hypothetical protein